MQELWEGWWGLVIAGGPEAALLASRSASSLPCTLKWPGTHSMCTQRWWWECGRACSCLCILSSRYWPGWQTLLVIAEMVVSHIISAWNYFQLPTPHLSQYLNTNSPFIHGFPSFSLWSSSNSLHHTAINQYVQSRWPQAHIQGPLWYLDGRPLKAQMYPPV